jgi:hypothetical protein
MDKPLIPWQLPKEEKFNGVNWRSWERWMGSMGRPNGNDLYWENLVERPFQLGSSGAIPELPDDYTDEGKKVTPLISKKPHWHEWVVRDSYAASCIMVNVINPDRFGLDDRTMTADALWAKLKDEFGEGNERLRALAEEELRAFKWQEGKPLMGTDGHFAMLDGLVKRANDLGAEISDLQHRRILVDSFPATAEWAAGRTIAYKEKTLAEAKTDLYDTYLTLYKRDDTNPYTSTTPNASSLSSAPKSDVAALTAMITKLQTEVTALNASRSAKPKVCGNTHCNRKKGHTTEECFAYGGGMAGQYPAWYKGNRFIHLPPDQRPKPTATSTSAPANLSATTPAANIALSVYPPPTVLNTMVGGDGSMRKGDSLWIKDLQLRLPEIRAIDEDQKLPGDLELPRISALMATGRVMPGNRGNRTIADAGASDHFFKHEENFADYTRVKMEEGRSSNENVGLSIVGMGKVDFFTPDKHIQFSNVLHCPDVRFNLISIARLDRLGLYSLYGGGRLRIFDANDNTIMTGALQDDNLYDILGMPTYPPSTSLSIADRVPASLDSPAPLSVWHRRMGHFGVSRIKEASTKLHGLTIVEGDESDLRCEPCVEGNQKRRAFDGVYDKATEVLGVVHLDLTGKYIPSKGGNTYAMKAVDDASSYNESMYTNSREAAVLLGRFMEWMKKVERQTGKKVKVLRTDMEPSLMGNLWDAFFKETGIVHTPTAPYTSANNGIAERAIGITAGSTRAMLNDAALPGRFWTYAWKYSELCGNLLPARRQSGGIPLTLFLGKTPSVAGFRVFGCLAFAHIPEEHHLSKVDPHGRGLKGIFIGIDDNHSSTYLVWVPKYDEIIRSRDVDFFEHKNYRDYRLEEGSEGDDVTMESTEFDEGTIGEGDGPDRENSDEDPVPNIPRRSNRVRVVSAAYQRSQDYQQNDPHVRNTLPTFANIAEANPSLPEPDNFSVPRSAAEALKAPHLWGPPMDLEISQLIDREVVIPFAVTEDNRDYVMDRLVGLVWAFSLKLTGDGRLKARKARCAADGRNAEKGTHYVESFSAVPQYKSVRLLSALGTTLGFYFWMIDFVGAYLNAEPQSEVFMRIPAGFERRLHIPGAMETVLRLGRSLYGLPDSGNQWFTMLNAFYDGLGLEKSSADICVRFMKDYGEDGKARIKTAMSTWTDDVYGISKSKADADTIITSVSERFKITNIGSPELILGISVIHHENGDKSYHQQNLIKEVLAKFNYEKCRIRSTPLPTNVTRQINDAYDEPITPEEEFYLKDKNILSLMGSLNHLANGTRYDIAYAVSLLQRFVSNPRPIIWTLALHILAYIRGTIHYSIRYHANTDAQPIGYCDSSFEDDLSSSKSTMGYAFKVAGGLISWSSKAQARVALSSTEAEYLAQVHAAKEAIWIDEFIGDIVPEVTLPVTIYADNQGAMDLTRTTKHHARTKHIKRAQHWVREAVSHGEVRFEYISTQDNVADLFTKSLGGPQLRHLLRRAGMEGVMSE